MEEINNIFLSVLVVSHNQKEFLGRCLDSILSQKIRVPWEIIVSDDNSEDGSYEYAKSFAIANNEQSRYANENDVYAPIIRIVQCNSDDAKPLMVSERCGWNKLNAYEYARGKYFVNIDADDYLLGHEIYQAQIDVLESNPDSSMCMQRALYVRDGDAIENGKVFPDLLYLRDGVIVPTDRLLNGEARGVNPTFMIRRHPEDNMRNLYGKWFDDTIITYHHMQYGPVSFIDRACYVYVQYPKSINHNMSHSDRDVTYGLLPIHHALLIPSLSLAFLREGLQALNHLIKCLPSHPDLSQEYRSYLSQFDAFLNRYYTAYHHSFFDVIRIRLSRFLLLIGIVTKVKSTLYLKIIYKVLI